MGKDGKEYVRHPKTIVDLAINMRNIINDYWTGDVKEGELREYIYYVVDNCNVFETGGEMNKTVKKILGEKRRKLIMKLLEHYQMKLY